MKSFIPVVIIMAIIFGLSHTPGDQLPQSTNGFDKLFHTIAYAALGLSALFAVRKKFQQAPGVTSLMVILFCLAYGISDELHQSFIPNRSPSVHDILADITGGMLAVLTWTMWSKIPKKTPFQTNGKAL